MAVGVAGDLRQVRDAQDLMELGEAAEFAADDGAKTAADVGVDLVEDEDGDAVALGEDALECEHDARQFAARGDLAEGLSALAWIRLGHEFELVETRRR